MKSTCPTRGCCAIKYGGLSLSTCSWTQFSYRICRLELSAVACTACFRTSASAERRELAVIAAKISFYNLQAFLDACLSQRVTLTDHRQICNQRVISVTFFSSLTTFQTNIKEYKLHICYAICVILNLLLAEWR